ncbi:MAG: penicillin acylase family protein, partial [Sphingobacteriia bacterium]
MRILTAFLSLLAPAGLIYVLSIPLPGIPPLGPFISPWHGFWQNAETEAPVVGQGELRLPGIQDEVELVYDSRLVPHIFAHNEADLYYAQGYVTASLRLWQMETQTRYAAGRLSEVFGDRTLEVDRRFRRMGLEWAARRSLEVMMADATTRQVLEAYCQGVNDYIRQLHPSQYPLMYKLLNYAPRSWEPLHVALLLKYMSWNLTGSSYDEQLTQAAAQYGTAVLGELYPDFPELISPIVPNEILDVQRAPGPGVPHALPVQAAGTPNPLARIQPNPHNGSNNWALAGSRTQSGYPLLANDPHLHLGLPSLWFEVQLHAPGINVYGATLAGAPGVLVGFNEQASWGITTTGSDVLDWYRITQSPDGHKYKYGEAWRPLTLRTDTVRSKSGKQLIERTWHSHHGPIVWKEQGQANMPAGYAMRWAGHDAGNELLTFYLLNRTHSYPGYLKALASYYCPAQNFVFADTSGTIAIWSYGRLPLKAKGQGKQLLDGSDPAQDWQGWVPAADNPHIVNPKRGYVASANQNPVGDAYPYYLGWSFASWERASRIEGRLAAMQRATPEDFRRLQLDNTNVLAEKILPRLLVVLQQGLDPKKLQQPDLAHAYAQLKAWNYRHEPGSLGATYFQHWWLALDTAIWQDQLPGPTYRYPPRAVTAQLIAQQDTGKWYDDLR